MKKEKAAVVSHWGRFTIVPVEVLESDLSPRAVLVFIALMSHVDHSDHDAKCWPSYEGIQRRCAIKGRGAINAALDELEQRGLLKRERRFSASTLYTLARVDLTSSKSELMDDSTVVPNQNDSSSESELQKFQNGTLTRITEQDQTEQESNLSRAARDEVILETTVDDDDPFSEGYDLAKLAPTLAALGQLPEQPKRESITDAPKPKRERKSKATLTPEESQRHAELFDGLARICVVDAKLVGGQIARTAKQLRQADADANGATCDAFLEWWKTSDFRGRNGKPPMLAQVVSSWKMFRGGYGERPATMANDKQRRGQEMMDRIARVYNVEI